MCILVIKQQLFSTLTELILLLTALMSSFFKETWVWGKYIKTLNFESSCRYRDTFRNGADGLAELVSKVL